MGTSTQDVQRTSGDGAELTLGFIGLGNMGAPMAANLARAGRRLLVHDVAGTRERAPSGAALAEDNQSGGARCGRDTSSACRTGMPCVGSPKRSPMFGRPGFAV